MELSVLSKMVWLINDKYLNLPAWNVELCSITLASILYLVFVALAALTSHTKSLLLC